MTIRHIFAQPVARSRVSIQAVLVCAAVASAGLSLLANPGLEGAAGALLALIMLAIATIDARRQIIPNELNAAAFALALSYAVIQNADAATEAIEAVVAATLRGGALAMFFLVLRLGYQRWRAREGIGLGDVKLAGVAGAWLGWPTIPVAIEIAALSALAVYGVRHYWLGRQLSPTTRLPFGLFLAPAIWLGWLLETTMLVAPHRSPSF